MKPGIVELEYRSKIAFYTIKGINFGKIKSKERMMNRMMMMKYQSSTLEITVADVIIATVLALSVLVLVTEEVTAAASITYLITLNLITL